MDVDLWCMYTAGKSSWVTLEQCESIKCEFRDVCSEYQMMTDALDGSEWYEAEKEAHAADSRGVALKREVRDGSG